MGSFGWQRVLLSHSIVSKNLRGAFERRDDGKLWKVDRKIFTIYFTISARVSVIWCSAHSVRNSSGLALSLRLILKILSHLNDKKNVDGIFFMNLLFYRFILSRQVVVLTEHQLTNDFYCFLQLSGGLQIFFGASFAWNHLNYSLVLGNNFWVPSTILLCLGPVTYLLCWLGWNAVSKKNRNYLKIVRSKITLIFDLF